MVDPIDEAAARALPCLKTKWCGQPMRARCSNCGLRPAVAAEMRALVERAVADCGDIVKAEADKFVSDEPMISSVLYFVEHLVRARARGEVAPPGDHTPPKVLR